MFFKEKSENREVKSRFSDKIMYKSRRGEIFFRDLYALLRWSEECSDDCKVKMENGNYEVIVCSWLPQPGKRGRQSTNKYLFYC